MSESHYIGRLCGKAVSGRAAGKGIISLVAVLCIQMASFVVVSAFAEMMPVEIMLARGRRMLQLDMPDDAYQLFQDALQVYGRDERILEGLGRSLQARISVRMEKGEYEQAQKLYHRGMELFPDDISYREGKAELLYITGQYESAWLKAEKLLEMGSELVARWLLARILARRHLVDMAVQEYSRIVGIQDSPVIFLEKAILHFRRLEMSRARRYLLKAAESEDSSVRDVAAEYLGRIDSGAVSRGDFVLHGIKDLSRDNVNRLFMLLQRARRRTGILLGLYPGWQYHVYLQAGPHKDASDHGVMDQAVIRFVPQEKPKLWELKFPVLIDGAYEEESGMQLAADYAFSIAANLSDRRAARWFMSGVADKVLASASWLDEQTIKKSGQIIRFSEKESNVGDIEALILSNDFSEHLAGRWLALSFVEFIENRGGAGAIRRILKRVGDGMEQKAAIAEELMAPFDRVWKSWLKSVWREHNAGLP